MSISHELAKELKGAGFPQENGEWYQRGDRIINAHEEDAGLLLSYVPRLDTTEPVKIPSLEELIEACGVRFNELEKIRHTRKPGLWTAYSLICEECGVDKNSHAYGKTPTEAVARLWLVLNKK